MGNLYALEPRGAGRKEKTMHTVDTIDAGSGVAGGRPLPGLLALVEGLWRRSHDVELPAHPGGRVMAEAAAQAVLHGLRRCRDRAELFAAYREGAAQAADFAPVASLVPPPVGARGRAAALAPCYPIREAAYWLRWQELADAAGR